MNEEKQEQNLIDGETDSWIEKLYRKNQKIINYAGGGIMALILLTGGGRYYLHKQESEARDQILGAIRYFEKDSIDLALKGDGQNMGFEDLADEYKWTPTANLCYYYMGICYFHKGNTDEAIRMLKKFSSRKNMVAASALHALGAAYEDKQEPEKAAAYYEKSAFEYENELTTPIYLSDAARVYERIGEKKKALKLYKEIKKNFPNSNEGREIDKYISRVEHSPGE